MEKSVTLRVRGDKLEARRTRDSGNRPAGDGTARAEQRRRHRDNGQEEGELHAAMGGIPRGLRPRADTRRRVHEEQPGRWPGRHRHYSTDRGPRRSGGRPGPDRDAEHHRPGGVLAGGPRGPRPDQGRLPPAQHHGDQDRLPRRQRGTVRGGASSPWRPGSDSGPCASPRTPASPG